MSWDGWEECRSIQTAGQVCLQIRDSNSTIDCGKNDDGMFFYAPSKLWNPSSLLSSDPTKKTINDVDSSIHKVPCPNSNSVSPTLHPSTPINRINV